MPSGSNPTSSTNERPRTQAGKRGRRTSSPTDSDNEDPFHFDNILSSSSSPTKRETHHDDGSSRALSSSLLRRASIVPVDPNAEPAPHRFSLLRERASEETIFVQEICDAEGRRWSLRVPASGLPEDMVHMLEELEKLAVELGQALPKIVVTCSTESLSMKRMERNAAAAAVNSSKLLCPPPAVGDQSSVGYDAGTGLSLAKEKNRITDPERGTEEPSARASESPSAAVSSPSERSLTCIYLPEVSRLRLQLSFQYFSSAYDLILARTRVLIRQLNFSGPRTGTRLPQQANTDDPMPTPTRLLLGTQRTTTNEQHRQASNNVALNEDRRIGIQSSHRYRFGGHAAFASEIEIAHPGPGRQVKVGIADLEDE